MTGVRTSDVLIETGVVNCDPGIADWTGVARRDGQSHF